MKTFFLCLCAVLGCLLPGYSAPNAAETVVLKQEDLTSIGPLGWVAADLEIPDPDLKLPLIHPNDKGPGAAMLRRLAAKGVAGGFEGVIYDNRDRGHSTFYPGQFSRMVRLSYDKGLKENHLDYGIAGRIILPAIVIGNSSTAITTKPIGRSQTRFAMTTNFGPERAFLTYANNHIYIYPEHHDHDQLDRFPANWPYTITSQGSSGSDRPFMRALALTVAALRPETRDFLKKERLVSPTLQMILRQGLKGVYGRDGYLSGKAHPVVFDEDMLAPERMVAFANTLQPQDIPPLVRLTVEKEDFTLKAGLAGLSEKLFDTPSAIARLWRSQAYRREMFVSAADTRDPNGRKLTYSWVLLHGDPDKVRISRLDSSGARARILVDWHDPWQSNANQSRRSSRVDIGVFANNGVHLSAPAIISIHFPHHQKRQYTRLPTTGEMALTSVDYAGGKKRRYFDPVIYWSADWRDEFTYDSDGAIETWTRIAADGQGTALNPFQAQTMSYRLEQTKKGPRLRAE